jgi:hypothetical protein
MSFFAKLGEKLPNVFQLGKKGLDYLVKMGEKGSQVAHSSIVQGILGVLPDTISKPVQTGINLFDTVLSGAQTLSHDINSGEQMVKRVAGAVELSKKMDIPKMTQNAQNIQQRVAPSGMTQMNNRTPTLMSGVSSLTIPDFNPMTRTVGSPAFVNFF